MRFASTTHFLGDPLLYMYITNSRMKKHWWVIIFSVIILCTLIFIIFTRRQSHRTLEGVVQTTIVQDGIKYEKSENGATIIATTRLLPSVVVIPSSVKIGGKSLKVNAIIDSVDVKPFQNKTEMESIIIPNSITKIQGYEFANNKSLNTIIFLHTETLPSVSDTAFYNNTFDNITVIYNSTVTNPEVITSFVNDSGNPFVSINGNLEQYSMRDYFKFFDSKPKTNRVFYDALKQSNTDIVKMMSTIHTQFTNNNFSNMKSSCENLIAFLQDASSNSDVLAKQFNFVEKQPNYFKDMNLAIQRITKKTTDLSKYIEKAVRERPPYSKSKTALNTDNFILVYKNNGIVYEEMCREIYKFLESKTAFKSENGTTFTLPRPFYCRYNPNSDFKNTAYP